MITRSVTIPIELALKRQAAVAIIGPRQVGKTTLARTIADSHPGALYLDLEARQDREKLVEPVIFLRQYENSLVVLDEIHRVPELFNSLRGIIDQGRRTGHRTGRFLILGSASIDLLRQSGESLAGRISYIDMGPFYILELRAGEPTLLQLWLRGGFPGSYLVEDDGESLRWRTDFIRTYLERDVAQFGPRVPAGVLERLWTMLAHGQGTLLNASRLAAGLQISAPTVHR
jgi:predicted AAA+ superfamily ATPase